MLLASVTTKEGLNYFSIEGDKLNVKDVVSTHNSFVSRMVSLRNSEEGSIVPYGEEKLNVWTTLANFGKKFSLKIWNKKFATTAFHFRIWF